MTPRLSHIILGFAGVITLLGLIALGADTIGRKIVAKHEAQSSVAHGKAEAHEEQAKTQDAEVKRLQAAHLEDQARLDKLTSERGALLRKLAAAKQDGAGNSSPAEGSDAASVAPVSTELEAANALIGKDAEVIEAQAKKITDQDILISALTVSRDQWKATAIEREREAVGLRIALEAQKGVSKSDRWLGRIEGLAVGVGIGYVGGRLR